MARKLPENMNTFSYVALRSQIRHSLNNKNLDAKGDETHLW